MGFFDKFKKKPESPKLPENEAFYEIFSFISEKDPAVSAETDRCLTEPKSFAKSHENDFIERCVHIDKAEDNELKWLGCTDILIRNGYACELDYSCELSDFIFSVNGLKALKTNGIELCEEDFDESGDITQWLAQNRELQACGMCFGAVDIDSDSYVIFAVKSEKLEKLKELAKISGHHIDHAYLM